MNKENIQEKKKKLEAVRNSLKKEFFGIDEQIDKIIESISSWFILPEIISRPLIINLWGLTGVGKTSVIRSLVNHLGFAHKFLELQLNGKEEQSILSCLLSSSINMKETGVVLLDEFQRFRTVNENGGDIESKTKMSDIWMLLSDGRFPPEHIYAELSNIIADSKDNITYERFLSKENGEESKPKSFIESQGYESFKKGKVKILKRYVFTDLNEEQIWSLSNQEILEKTSSAINSGLNLSVDYTKCLIFISGNLDEVFSIAGDTDDCDTDADTLHNFTKKISVMEVKKGLSKRFRPEQIARLGNDHIIYPSLDSSAYNQIIRDNCMKYIIDAEKISGVNIRLDQSIFDIIYRNSVYPSQGTRPVFSTIQKIFTSPLSSALLWSIENEYKEFVVKIDSDSNEFVASNGIFEKRVSVNLDVDDRRKRYSKDFLALIAVHEAGHAVVYAELFKAAPRQIKVNAASFNGGYNIFDTKAKNKNSILNEIAVGMGGIVAEEIVFGIENRSRGSESDIEKISKLASKYVRCYGMNGINSRVKIDGQETNYIQGTEESDRHIEEILTEQKKKALDILNKNKQTLVKISRDMIEKKNIDAATFAKDYGHLFSLKESSPDIHGNYAELLDNL